MSKEIEFVARIEDNQIIVEESAPHQSRLRFSIDKPMNVSEEQLEQWIRNKVALLILRQQVRNKTGE